MFRGILITAMLMLIAASPAIARPPRLWVSFGGIVGGDCQPEVADAMLAGSQADIVLQISGDTKEMAYRGLPSGPPNGLVLNCWAESDGATDSPWSTALLQRLAPQFYVTIYQVEADSVYRRIHKISPQHVVPEYRFLVRLPQELAGKKLCVFASLDDPQFGHLSGSGCVDVVAPRTQNDEDLVCSSYIKFAIESRNFEDAVRMADSLLNTSWHSFDGLFRACEAAHFAGRFDRELAYTDSLYSWFGTIEPGYAPYSAQSEQNYRNLRSRIVKNLDGQRSGRR